MPILVFSGTGESITVRPAPAFCRCGPNRLIGFRASLIDCPLRRSLGRTRPSTDSAFHWTNPWSVGLYPSPGQPVKSDRLLETSPRRHFDKVAQALMEVRRRLDMNVNTFASMAMGGDGYGESRLRINVNRLPHSRPCSKKRPPRGEP
ncbi:MAG: hypothetical protein WD534_15480 [Phycisphaeraceae bacterium]